MSDSANSYESIDPDIEDATVVDTSFLKIHIQDPMLCLRPQGNESSFYLKEYRPL